MKKYIVLLFVSSLLLACQNRNGYTITGKINGEPDGKVYLCLKEDNIFVCKDSTALKNGAFMFSGKPVAAVTTGYIQIDGTDGYWPFFLENGNINMAGNVEEGIVSFTGTPNNDALTGYNNDNGIIQSKITETRNKLNAASNSRDAKVFNSTFEQYLSLQKESEDLLNAYVSKYNTSEFAAYLLLPLALEIENAVEVDSLVARLAPSLNESVYVAQMKEYAQTLRSLEPGNPAPEIILPSLSGEPVALSSLRGKYVLIDFWASWCGPCRDELPNLLKAYSKYKDNFEIYAISLDTRHEDWEKIIRQKKLPWVNVSDLKRWNCPATSSYAVKRVPYTILLDKEGIIIAKDLHGEALNEKLKEIAGQ